MYVLDRGCEDQRVRRRLCQSAVAYSRGLEHSGKVKDAIGLLTSVLDRGCEDQRVRRRLAQLQWKCFAVNAYLAMVSNDGEPELEGLAAAAEKNMAELCRANEWESFRRNRARRRLAFERSDSAYMRGDWQRVQAALEGTCGRQLATSLARSYVGTHVVARPRMIVLDLDDIERGDSSAFQEDLRALNAAAYLWRFGFLENSYLVRERCLSRIVGRKDGVSGGVGGYLGRLAELEWDVAHGRLDGLRPKNGPEEHRYLEEVGLGAKIVEHTKHRTLLTEGLEAFAAINERDIDDDWKFRGLVRGKAVAIIGGAYSVDVSEFDDFDVLIVLGTSLPEGLRTDKVKVISVGATPGRLLTAEWGVEQSKKGVAALIGSRYIGSGTLGGLTIHARQGVPDLWSGSLNHGFGLIYEIYRYKPARLKVFGMNFYLSENVYKGDYIATAKSLSLHTILTQANHDNISQRRFVSGLVDHVGLELDGRCADVLSLSDQEYVDGMCDVVMELGKH